MDTTLEEYWSDVRNGLGSLREEQALETLTLLGLHRWAQDLKNLDRPSFVVLTGDNRDHVYERFRSEEWMFDEPGFVHDLCGSVTNAWVSEGLVKYLTNRVRDLLIPPEYRDKQTYLLPLPEVNPRGWEILWALSSISFLVVQEPLDDLIDKRFSLLSDVHRVLMEARFAALETKGSLEIQTAIHAMGRWIEGCRHAMLTGEEKGFLQHAQVSQAVTEAERFEVILFLLTLARQNGVIGGIVLALDGLEDVADKATAEELFKLLEMTERWTKMGSPLGILLGWRGTKEDRRRLRKLHPRLAKRVAEADAWVRKEG